MAPINLPNGTEVSEIVLPNGATASEVIAPDGSTVVGAIPDTALFRLQFNDDSDTSTAVDSWQDNDGSISGATYTTTAQEGSHALSFDGTDDIVTIPQSYRGDTALSGFSWFQVNTFGSVPETIMHDGSFFFRTNRANQNTDLSALVADGSGGFIRTKIGSSLTDGAWYFAGFSAGPNNGQLLRVYDTSGLVEEVAASRQNTVPAPDGDLGIGAENSNSENLDGIIDDPRMDGQEYTAAEMDEVFSSY